LRAKAHKPHKLFVKQRSFCPTSTCCSAS